MVSEWQSVIGVSLNVGSGVRLIKKAKLYMCMQTHYKHDEDGCMAPCVHGHGNNNTCVNFRTGKLQKEEHKIERNISCSMNENTNTLVSFSKILWKELIGESIILLIKNNPTYSAMEISVVLVNHLLIVQYSCCNYSNYWVPVTVTILIHKPKEADDKIYICNEIKIRKKILSAKLHKKNFCIIQ